VRSHPSAETEQSAHQPPQSPIILEQSFFSLELLLTLSTLFFSQLSLSLSPPYSQALALAAPFATSLAARRHLPEVAGRTTELFAPSLISLPWLSSFLLSGLAAHRALSAPAAPLPLRLAAGASLLTLCVAVQVVANAASSAATAAAAAAAAVAAASAALSSFYSLDPGAGALLLPLCCWGCFSASLALLSRSSSKERRGGGERGGTEEEEEGEGAVASTARKLAGLSTATAKTTATAAAAATTKAKATPAAENGGAPPLLNGTGGGEGDAAADDVLSAAAPVAAAEAATTEAATTEAATTTTTTTATPPPPPQQPPLSLPARPAPSSDSLLPGSFGDPRAASFRVRGPTYFADRNKIEPLDTKCRLSAMELVSVSAPTPHIARFLPSIRDSKAPFTFVWQVMVPGRPRDISMVCAWELGYDPLQRVREHVEARRAARERAKGKVESKKGRGFESGRRRGTQKKEEDDEALRLLLRSPAAAAANDDSKGNSDPLLNVELSGVSAEAGGLLSLSPPSPSRAQPPSSADKATSGLAFGGRRNNNNKLPFTVGGHRRASTAAGAGDADAAGDPFGFSDERSGSGAVPALAPVSGVGRGASRLTAAAKTTTDSEAAALDDEDEEEEEEEDGGETEAEGDEKEGESENDDLAGCDPFDLALARFIEAGGPELGAQTSSPSVKERHARFKIIPRIEVGPW